LRIIKSITFSMLLISACVFAGTQEEIDYLLGFVSNTDCQYNRNGTDYDGKEARDHIEVKYEYYLDDIKTSEDFIRYSATSSKISGIKYRIKCSGSEAVNANDWLLHELKKYREKELR
jgi:hypothetical protein